MGMNSAPSNAGFPHIFPSRAKSRELRLSRKRGVEDSFALGQFDLGSTISTPPNVSRVPWRRSPFDCMEVLRRHAPHISRKQRFPSKRRIGTRTPKREPLVRSTGLPASAEVIPVGCLSVCAPVRGGRFERKREQSSSASFSAGHVCRRSQQHDAFDETIYGLECTTTWTVVRPDSDSSPRLSVSASARAVLDATTRDRSASPWRYPPGVMTPDLLPEVHEVLAATPRRPAGLAKIAEVMRRIVPNSCALPPADAPSATGRRAPSRRLTPRPAFQRVAARPNAKD